MAELVGYVARDFVVELAVQLPSSTVRCACHMTYRGIRRHDNLLSHHTFQTSPARRRPNPDVLPQYPVHLAPNAGHRKIRSLELAPLLPLNDGTTSEQLNIPHTIVLPFQGVWK